MARIEKRGENSWRITVELGRDKATGERRIFRKTVRCGKGKVKTEAKLFEAEIRKGTYFKPNSTTLAVHLRDWLKRKRPYIKRLTYRDYNMFIEKHFIQYFGENLLLKDLETYHIERYKNYKLTEGRLNGSGGLAARTVQITLLSLLKLWKMQLRSN